MNLYNIKLIVKKNNNYIELEDSTKANNKYNAIMNIVKGYNKEETEVIDIVSIRKLPNR